MKRYNRIIICFLLAVLLSACSSSHTNIAPASAVEDTFNGAALDNADAEVKVAEEELKDSVDEDTLTILACGDLIYHMPIVRSCWDSQTGVYDFRQPFQFVSSYIENADLSIVNFETAIVPDKPYAGFPLFNTPKEALWALKEVGFNLINTANNHSLDGGEEGLLNVIDACDEFQVVQIGTQRQGVKRTRVLEIKNKKLGFLSYTYALNGNEWMLGPEKTDKMVNVINKDKIQEDISHLLKEEVDQIIAIMHWGNEYQEEASVDQVSLAHEMIDLGVDVILGSHPHVVQNSEVYQSGDRQGLIIYSMGNFLSNQYESTMGNKRSEDGLMVELKFQLEEAGMFLSEVVYHPSWVFKDPIGDYHIIPIKEYIDGGLGEYQISEWAVNRINDSLEATMDKMEEFNAKVNNL